MMKSSSIFLVMAESSGLSRWAAEEGSA